MQIITGKYRARRLVSPEGESTRPTLARIKESIFSILPLSFSGKVVLDLFAGSGAYGLECVSRGAEKVYLVDQSKQSINAIRKNALNMKEDIEILENDCFEALKKLQCRKVKLDYVFLDPPYKSDFGEKVLAFLESHDMLEKGGVIIYEHSNDKKLLPKLLKRYIIEKSRTYASIVVDFITLENEGN